ncbi:uncharacterized protein V6R79_008499 [Siganus canaliculatus]
MMNCSPVSHFVLSAYFDTGVYRYILFLVVKLLYAAIICSNVLLILVIWSSRSLHEPMYLFLRSLFVNELYGSTGLFPFLLLQILSDVHTVSTSFYFVQVFVLFTYGNVEFINLAVMSYDRYLAICHPLQYRARMTPLKVALLVALVWFFPLVEVGVMVSLSASLRLGGNTVNRVYCDNYSIIRLACSDATASNIYGVVYSFLIVFTVLGVFLYTYARILRMQLLNSSGVSYFTLAAYLDLGPFRPLCFLLLLSLYAAIVCSNVLLILPLLTPIVYGLQTSRIRAAWKRLLGRRLSVGCSDEL